MILFEEALQIIEDCAIPVDTEKVKLETCLGRILAVDVFSDMDMPPFDKSAVDGYSCRFSDLKNELKVLEIIPAGKVPTRFISKDECSKLMTGGMLPDGADTVIMVEDVDVLGVDTIRFVASGTSPNFCKQAEDIGKGAKVLEKGTFIRPQEIAILASVGCANPEVYKQPVIGVISTGDELVEPNEIPSKSQIRNSNAWQLLAQVQRAGCIGRYFGIADDTEKSTQNLIEDAANQCDIVILTGGISAGDFDFVPKVIQQVGFDIKFRSLAVQPGKPIIFATRENKYLVALPGNPVSSFVQFEMTVRHLISLITGNPTSKKDFLIPIGIDYTRKKTARKAFFPVYFTKEGTALPVEYHGSAHIHSYIYADGIATIEIGEKELTKGTPLHVRPI
jgi:molybdopterin molybdotransferase